MTSITEGGLPWEFAVRSTRPIRLLLSFDPAYEHNPIEVQYTQQFVSIMIHYWTDYAETNTHILLSRDTECTKCYASIYLPAYLSIDNVI